MSGLAQWALEDLVDVGVGQGFQGLGPLAVLLASHLLGAGLALPAQLLHVVVNLQQVAVGVLGVGHVVDAGVQLFGHLLEGDAAVLEEADAILELLVGADFQTEGCAGGVGAAAQLVPQLLG